jgi:hypothetical protein
LPGILLEGLGGREESLGKVGVAVEIATTFIFLTVMRGVGS